MTEIVSINPNDAVFETDTDQPGRLSLVLTDKDGQLHRLTFEASALREFAEIFRGIQERFPGALGVH